MKAIGDRLYYSPIRQTLPRNTRDVIGVDSFCQREDRFCKQVDSRLNNYCVRYTAIPQALERGLAWNKIVSVWTIRSSSDWLTDSCGALVIKNRRTCVVGVVHYRPELGVVVLGVDGQVVSPTRVMGLALCRWTEELLLSEASEVKSFRCSLDRQAYSRAVAVLEGLVHC